VFAYERIAPPWGPRSATSSSSVRASRG
jgi:hypothetical protein